MLLSTSTSHFSMKEADFVESDGNFFPSQTPYNLLRKALLSTPTPILLPPILLFGTFLSRCWHFSHTDGHTAQFIFAYVHIPIPQYSPL